METALKYNYLIQQSYEQATNSLILKYGIATGDYFKENSYDRFLNNEIKTIAKNKIQRTTEGLYVHHIDENLYENLSKLSYIKEQEPPFIHQKADRLVYCDLIEHTILHSLIAKESSNRFGYKGLKDYLVPTIEDWYISKNKPTKNQWQINCYQKAYLSSTAAKELLIKISFIIGEDYEKIKKDSEIKKIGFINEQFIELKKLIQDLKDNLDNTWDRKSIVSSLAYLQYRVSYVEKLTKPLPENFYPYSRNDKEYIHETNQFIKEDLCNDIFLFIEKIEKEVL